MGAKGVSSAIEVIREGFDNAMILTGSPEVKNLSRDNLFRAPLTN
jgi:isopentenyl diphosphate isomerase/L-lactate dehydrogenase-like FMN-dependent dehydrogenase